MSEHVKSEENIDSVSVGASVGTIPEAPPIATPTTYTDTEDKEPVPKPKEETPTPKRKIFSRADIVRTVPVSVSLPMLYPGFDPFEFDLRLKMTQDAEERRQEYLALTPSEQTVKEPEQNLDELCDLLTKMPKGFADLKDNGGGAGPSFKDYVLTSDPVTKDMLLTITRGAITLYWRKISPQEFRKSV